MEKKKEKKEKGDLSTIPVICYQQFQGCLVVLLAVDAGKAAFGWDVFNQDTLYKAHKKRIKKVSVSLPLLLADGMRSSSSLTLRATRPPRPTTSGSCWHVHARVADKTSQGLLPRCQLTFLRWSWLSATY